MIVIPAIDLKNGQCVRLLQGREKDVTVYSDDPVAMACQWEEQGAGYLHVVDLDGAFSGEPKNFDWVAKIAAAVKMPIELGGGIRSIDQIRRALGVGVDRVVLGTKATSESFLDEALREFGAERLVVGIDAKDGKVAVAGWTQKTELSAVEFAKRVFQLGTYRIIFTDVSTDGMLSGPPLASVRKLCEAVGCFIIASGGVGSLDDLQKLRELQLPNLEGVIVGKALYEKKFSLKDALS